MPTVLIVDDTLFMRATIQRMFINWGFQVVGCAKNGQEAVQLFQELEPDLVTMDLTMPVMTGLDALKEIMPQYPAAKIIILSALGKQNVVKEAIESGAKDFIIKPFKAEQLKEVIQNVLNIEAI